MKGRSKDPFGLTLKHKVIAAALAVLLAPFWITVAFVTLADLIESYHAELSALGAIVLLLLIWRRFLSQRP